MYDELTTWLRIKNPINPVRRPKNPVGATAFRTAPFVASTDAVSSDRGSLATPQGWLDLSPFGTITTKLLDGGPCSNAISR